MAGFEETVKDAIDGAATAAGDSTRLWFETFARAVGRATDPGAPAPTADDVAKDVAALNAAWARDATRAVQAWVAIGTALTAVDLPDAPPGGGGGP